MVLDLLTYAGNRENLHDIEDLCLFVQGDIAERPFIAQLLSDKKIDIPVNSAAESHYSLAVLDPSRFFRTNADSGRRRGIILRHARSDKYPCRRSGNVESLGGRCHYNLKLQSPESHPAVLDLGCGLGRHAIAFAKKGFRVTATEASQRAIDHLQSRAEQLDLSIATHVCSMLEQPFHQSLFDIVLSYNVIYHGRKSHFVEAIGRVWNLLKPSGLFYFTCPLRKDGKYGYGECIAPHTYASTKSVTPGDIHYFTDRTELCEMLTGFTICSIDLDEGYWNNKGEEQFFSNWQVLAQKVFV